MITGEKSYLDDLAKKFLCKDHETPVVVAWHDTENSYGLRCGQGHYPEEIIKQRTRTQNWQEGKIQAVDPTMSLLPTTDLATGEILPGSMVQALIKYAYTYGLDPYRGHIVLIYGKPYIGLEGYLFYAAKKEIPYTLTSKPLTEADRRDYQVPEGDHAWLATLTRLDTTASVTGTGIVTKIEIEEESKKKPGQKRYPVVASHPWQIAQKRAEWQALRRAFPIGETVKEEEE